MKSRYAVHRPVVNTYLVRERDRRRIRELIAVIAVVAPVALALLAYTWIHLEVVRTGYRIDTAEKRLHRAEQIERQLRLEAAYLANPERLERRAHEELGMRPPETSDIIFAAEMR